MVFDPVTIIDRGTFTDPNHHPDGIQQVFVNGEAVVSDGDPTGARPGQVLRRSGAVKAGGRSWPDRAEPRVEPASSARPRSRQTEETR